MTELEVNSTLISDLADNVHVNMATAQVVDVNGTDVWERRANIPGTITDFSASDNLENFIECNWTPVSLAEAYHLADYDEQTILAYNINPGFGWSAAEPGRVYRLAIVAEGVEGNTISNVDEGMMIVRGDVIIDYNSVSGSNPETVTGSDGVFTFTPPQGVTEVHVCMIGGGGSGGFNSYQQDDGWAGGGHAGEIIEQDVSVTAGSSISIEIGKGGRGWICEIPGDACLDVVPFYSTTNGQPGGDTVFGNITATGGAGGNDGGADYGGDGGERITCVGTFYDGDRRDDGEGHGYGGQAGFGNGGNGATHGGRAGHGGTGAGGGGNNYRNYDGGASGCGGDGQIRISW